MATTSTFGI